MAIRFFLTTPVSFLAWPGWRSTRPVLARAPEGYFSNRCDIAQATHKNPDSRTGGRFLRSASLVVAVLLALISVAPQAAGLLEDSSEPAQTLHGAFEAAYARHPQHQALSARAGEAEAMGRHASSLMADNPTVGGLYKTDQIGSGDGFREWEAGIYLPLWKPGQRAAAKRGARRAKDALIQAHRALKIEVAGEVRERVWATVITENNRELAAKEWHTAEALARDVHRRVELGDLATNDLLLARDAVLTKHAAYLRAAAERDDAQQRYTAYTGLARLPQRRGEQRAPVTVIPEDHPLLARILARLRQAEAEIEAIGRRGAGAPELFLGSNGERGRSDEDFNTRLSVSLSLPIGVSAHIAPARAAALRARAEALADYESLRRELALNLVQATRALQSIADEIHLVIEQDRVAQENLRLAQVAFQAGETDLVGLLRTQALAFAAQRRQRELRIMQQRARARYNQAVGVLP